MTDTVDLDRERYLAIDRKLNLLLGDMRDVKHRLTEMDKRIADLYGMYASQSARFDRLDDRLDRIERRLEISDGDVK